MTRSALAALTAIGLAFAALPAQAAIIPPADFKPGSTIGVGYAGFSYDMGGGNWDLGAALNSDMNSIQRFKLGLRGLYRFMQVDNLAAGVLGGVQYDPGVPGSRSYLVPDVGLALAYTFPGTTPITLRLALTVTVDQYRNVDPFNPMPQGNLLQRLTFGPNSTIGAGLRLNEHLELTLGGGTLVGARLTL